MTSSSEYLVETFFKYDFEVSTAVEKSQFQLKTRRLRNSFFTLFSDKSSLLKAMKSPILRKLSEKRPLQLEKEIVKILSGSPDNGFLLNRL